MSVPGADIQVLDFDFFERLIDLTGNRVLGMLGGALRDVYFTHREVFAALYAPERFDLNHHRRALSAIAAGQPAAAAAAMEAHARCADGLFTESSR